jgi:hypothetical protein
MSAFPLGALISAGGSIISSMFGSKPKERSPADTIKSTVKGARAAGIHPLAALGASPQYSYGSSVGSSSGSAIGAGLEKAGMALAARKTEEEIDQIKADSEARRAQAELYRTQSRTIIQKAANQAIGGPRIDGGRPPKTIRIGGVPFTRDPKRFSSAQDAQDEFGDVIENIVGIPSFVWSGIRSAGDAIPSDKEIIDAAKRWYHGTRRKADYGPMP